MKTHLEVFHVHSRSEGGDCSFQERWRCKSLDANGDGYPDGCLVC